MVVPTFQDLYLDSGTETMSDTHDKKDVGLNTFCMKTFLQKAIEKK